MPGSVAARHHVRRLSPGTFTPKFIAHNTSTSTSNSNSITGSDDARDIAEFSGRRWVWLSDEEHAFVKGWVVEDRGSTLLVRCDSDAIDRTVSSDAVDKVNPPKFNLADDMADLTYLNEASVIHNLRQRYEVDLIYVHPPLPFRQTFRLSFHPY